MVNDNTCMHTVHAQRHRQTPKTSSRVPHGALAQERNSGLMKRKLVTDLAEEVVGCWTIARPCSCSSLVVRGWRHQPLLSLIKKRRDDGQQHQYGDSPH